MRKKKYILVFSEGNGIASVNSKNTGFNAFEILGILEMKKNDIYKQLTKNKKPDIIKTKVVED